MSFYCLLAVLTLYLVSISSQALQSSILKTTLETINPIEDLNTNPNSQDRFYVSNISQNTSKVASAPWINATPNITETLSIIDEDMSLVSISPDGQIAIFANYSCYIFYNISNLNQPTGLSQLCFELELGPTTTNLGVISSDSKTGFFVNSYQKALLVIDLSNPTYPSIINTFSFITPPSQTYPVKTSSMVLSSDGQTLFILSQVISQIITIIDVSNPGSLRIISTYVPPLAFDNAYINELYISNNMLFSMNNNVSVIDISDLENPTTLAAIDAGSSSPLNLAVSSDGQYLFVVSAADTDEYQNQHQAYLEVFDLSNLSSIIQQTSVFIGYWPNIGGISMTISLDNTRLYIAGFGGILFIDVSNIINPLLYNIDPQSYFGYDSSLTLLPDGKSVILSYMDETTIIQVQFDVPICLAENITATADIPVLNTMSLSGDYSDNSNVSMAVSSDGNIIFIQFPSNLDIIDVSNITSPNVLSTFNNTSLDNYCGAVTISTDGQTAFLVCTSSIITLNISDLSSPTILGTFPVNLQEYQYQLTLSSDGQIGFLLASTGMQILNLTNVSSPAILSTYYYKSSYTSNIIRMSQDPNIVYLYAFAKDQSVSFEDYLEIVDISNLASPVQIYSTRFETYSFASKSDLNYPVPLFMSISPGNQITILVFTPNVSLFRTVHTDTSHGSTTLPAQITTSELINLSPMTLMSALYSPTIYLLTYNGQVIVIDISTIASPMILRSFNTGFADSLALSPDDSTLFLTTSNGTLTIMDMTPQYSLYLEKSNFVLGEVFTNDLIPLALSSTNEFVTMEQDFVFTQVSLYNVTSGISNPVAYVALPHWISIDLDQLTVTFAPDDPSQIGSYQLYGVASTQILNDTFIGIGTITNATESFDLFVTLISLGYLNSQGFLTSSFNPTNNFFLTSQYSQYQTEVYNKLMEYYIEVITTFTVASSLYLEQVVTTFVKSSMETTISKVMALNTLNSDAVNVIFMLSTNQSQFVNSASIVVTILSNNQTTLSLQGSLTDINNAIPQIIINLDDITSCNGNMTISDGLNPILHQDIPNISDYFIKNQVPSLNPYFSIESLLYHTPVQTGVQFILDLSNMFIDSNGQDVQYTLTMQDNSQPLPDWLSFKGETIVGTPPKQLSQPEYNLVITVSNQFKSLSQPFTLNISYSLSYILELIGTYGGALLTIIGFYVYVHKIYNVLCKRRYRYQKDFLIRAGDKKSVKQICAISFISDEIQASKLILAEIKKTVAQEKNLSTVSMADLVQYFMEANSRQIEEDRVTQMIKSGMSIISAHKENTSKRTEFEHVKGYLRIKVIKELIINQLVNTQLNLKQERLTKQLFNRIKDDWMNLVETSRDHGFTLNKDKLAAKLKSMKINLYKPQKSVQVSIADAPLNNSPLLTSVSADRKNMVNFLDSGTLDSNLSPGVEGKKSVQKDLIDPIEVETGGENAGINFILLEKSIIAHAFKYHNLDVKPIEIEVCSHEKQFGTSCISRIKAFLKWDLYYVRFAKGCEVGYGITYKISNGILRFYGTPQEEIEDKTLVVQIVSRRGFIKKELWLNCVGKIAEDGKPVRVLVTETNKSLKNSPKC